MNRKWLRFAIYCLTIGVIAALTLSAAACTTATTTVKVTVAPTLSSIMILPKTPANLTVGATVQFTANATYSDGSTADITSQVTWSTDSVKIATIGNYGLAKGVAAGATTILATYKGVSGTAIPLTVVAAATP
jgi:hypothetical protein